MRRARRTAARKTDIPGRGREDSRGPSPSRTSAPLLREADIAGAGRRTRTPPGGRDGDYNICRREHRGHGRHSVRRLTGTTYSVAQRVLPRRRQRSTAPSKPRAGTHLIIQFLIDSVPRQQLSQQARTPPCSPVRVPVTGGSPPNGGAPSASYRRAKGPSPRPSPPSGDDPRENPHRPPRPHRRQFQTRRLPRSNNQYIRYDKALERRSTRSPRHDRGLPESSSSKTGSGRYPAADRYQKVPKTILWIHAIIVNGDLDDYMRYCSSATRQTDHLPHFDQDTIEAARPRPHDRNNPK